ncbi:MAG: surface lipoprotein assembly modifier [Neisseria sp.]|nr:surface lipoprotein assembly modifier [Neisseria sp.]
MLLNHIESETDKALNRQIEQAVPERLPDAPEASFMPSETEQSGFSDGLNPQTPLTLADVKAKPELSEMLLNQALAAQDFAAVAELLPVYRSLPERDETLVDFAQGALWRAQGEHKKAIALYRKILAEKPDLPTVRLDLAAMLFEDKQTRDAVETFEEAKAAGLPEEVLPRIDEYLAAAEMRDQWDFSARANYVRDDNINNASSQEVFTIPQLGSLPLTKNPESLPQSGRGVEYGASAQKDWNVGGNHYLTAGAALDGITYWDNHDFDDATLNVNAGYRNKSLKGEWSLVPFWEWRRYGGEKYYSRSGFDADYASWVSPRWRLSLGGGLGWKNYANHTDGRDARANMGATYLFGANTYFFGGVNYGRDKMHARPGASSKRRGVYLGWGQQWPWDFGSRLSVNRYNEYYDGTHYIYRDMRRKDKVTAGTLSLWNNKLSYWGITPKLNYRITDVDSNIDAFHSYRKQKLFISLDKAF